ncbi:MAG: ABC transporter ATP-binding protein [bacterium]
MKTNYLQELNSQPEISTAVVSVRNLTRTFRDFWGRPVSLALRGISFEIRAGEIFGLLGPNGSGKSTTLKAILGLLRPSSGNVQVFGRATDDRTVRERTGYLPEESYLYRHLTPRELLRFFADLQGLTRTTACDRIGQLLDMTGLTHAADRPVSEFSKGMARRVALAQALLGDPDLLLLDEPTSGLDPLGCRQVKDLILTLARRGTTVLVSSHRMADMQDVCDRVAILLHGRITVTGAVNELLRLDHTCRLTFPEPAPDDLAAIQKLIHTYSGADAALDYPACTLENFFVETVVKADNSETNPSGSRPMAALAPFLQGSLSKNQQ